MDPLSILGVASAVVAFVEFTKKLATKTIEVRSTAKGQPANVMRLAQLADDLTTVASTARDKVKNLSSSYPRHAEALEKLTVECSEVEAKLKTGLNKLTATPTNNTFKAMTSQLGVAIRSIWSAEEFKEWSRQLDSIRDQVTMNVLICVWDEIKKTGDKTERILQIVARIQIATDRPKNNFEDGNTGGHLSETSRKAKMEEAIWASTDLIDLQSDSDPSPPPYTLTVPPEGLGVYKKGDKRHFANKILRSLRFEEMKDRANQIESAFPKTFQWLFDKDDKGPENGKGRLAMSFREWLVSQEKSIFWVTGVPASGKSTLMKFLTTHQSLLDRLREWAGERVRIAEFYFWNPGSKIQKSRNGLLRSLLYQLLSLHPELAEAVAPRRRLFFDIAPDNAEAPLWEWTELRECIFRVASLLRTSGWRLALFIDGLDEYEGFVEGLPEDRTASHRTTDEMLEVLIDLHNKYDVKLCVSSRPLNYFRDKFRGCRSIAMQDLTQPDIDHYVEERLRNCPGIQDLRDVEGQNVDELISELKTKACGVFLWVVLVVEQLTQRSRDGATIQELRNVVRDLPQDLSKLYDTIQGQIGPEKECTASKLYQLIMAWKGTWSGQMEATFLWLAYSHDAQENENSYDGYFDPEMEQSITKNTERLLQGHTRGILQVSTPGPTGGPHTIDFLHKTAYEWLREINWQKVIGNGPRDYQPLLCILDVLVHHTHTLETKHSVLKQCLSRIFMLAGEVQEDNNPATRSKLVSIIDRVKPRHLWDMGIESLFFLTAVSTANKIIAPELATMTWAAAWACHPYLQGKLEADPSIPVGQQSKGFAFKQWFTKSAPQTQVSLLDAAIFGFKHRRAGLHWYIDVRKLSVWQAFQRLETVKVLLQQGAKIDNRTRTALKSMTKEMPPDSVDVKYLNLLINISGRHNFLDSFDAERRKVFSDDLVAKSHKDSMFPEYKIHV